MGFDDGDIIFDNPSSTYFTGQTVQGKLVFNQDKPKTFRGLYVKMKGFCDVHWTTSHTHRVNDKEETYTVNHNSHEVYFKSKVYLMGDAEDDECQLNPGHYEFPFQCNIPPHCPSSYEGAHGHIRYELVFVVDRSFKFDQEKKRQITVVAQRDLNKSPYCREPTTFHFQESYCCWCMSAGSCELLVKMPCSGYCPGQVMRLEVNCENKSNVEIDSIKFELKEDITFRATSEPGTKSFGNCIAKLVKGPIPGNTTRNWELEMEIPEMDLYNVEACKYIDIDYEFEVTISPSGCHESNGISRRIVLGHIPLREFEGKPSEPELTNEPAAPLQQYPAGYLPPTQPYPGAIQICPAKPPYPGAIQICPPNPQFPGVNSQYPGVNPPYTGANPPYPGGNPSYPGANPPYPGGNPPYPGVNPPYPGVNPPYPVPNQPYAPNPVPPSFGFTVLAGENKDGASIPLLPPGAGVPYPTSPAVNPYAAASAPEPGTPDFEASKPILGEASTPYNPEFIRNQNEEHK